MSQCVFVAADCPVPEVRPAQRYPRYINLDANTACDSGADDDFSLLNFREADLYCQKQYGVSLEMERFTEGRAKQIIDYIKAALSRTDSVELWNVWHLGYWEYEDRPIIHTETIPIGNLSGSDIQRLMGHQNWEEKNPERPHFYCMKIIP